MTDNPVILCYDGSDDAKLAIDRAAQLFGERPAIVLTVWQRASAQLSYGGLGVAYVPDLEAIDAASEEAATKLAAEGLELARAAGLTAEATSVQALGPVWQAILAAADERDGAVIVLGSRGLSGIKSLMLGSVSGSVMHHANRPTLVVRHGVPAIPVHPSAASSL